MKKVISFVLVLALVLGSFSMAFALTDIEGNDNAEAINVVNDLGIVTGYTDGSFQPEKAVNRAEFAAMITRALGVPESALAGYTATSFKDTAGYGWAVKYLAFCDSKGIMLGDGNGNAMPGNTITVNEAVTMVLRAIGYTNNSAVLVGTWPGNYVTLAQDLNLYDDVAAVATVDRASAAQIIYNALTVTKVQVDADGQTTPVTDSPNMLTSGLGCKQDATATMIDGSEDAVIDTKALLGTVGIKIWNSDDELVAIKDVETTYITVDELGADYIKDGDTKYYEASSYNFAALTTPAALFTNGVENATTGAVAEGQVIAAVLSGKTITDVKAVIEWTGEIDFQFTADDLDIDAAELYGEDFTTLEDGSIDYDSFTIEGAASIDKIPEDAVVYIYTAGSPAEITKILVGTETVTGTIAKKDADGYYYINGTAYGVVGSAVTDANIGQTGTATLDGYGDIYDWTEDDASKDNFAIAVKSGKTTDAYGDDTYYVTFVDAQGVEQECTVKSSVTSAAAGLTDGDIFEYALDNAGKLKTITERATTTDAITGAVGTNIIGVRPIADNAVVWTWDADEETYVLSSTDKLDTEATASGSQIYGYVKNGKLVAMVVTDAVTGGSSDSYGVITNTYKSYNEADETTYWYVEGAINGNDLAAYSDVEAIASAPAISTSGAVLKKLSVDTDGVVTISDDLSGIYSSTGALSTTVAGVDNGMIKVEVSTDNYAYYTLADGYVAYVYDADEDAFVVKKLATNTVKNKTVYMYQTEDTVTGYDIVVVY